MVHPLVEVAEYKARYMMLASGEPTERLERVAKAAKALAESALEMARTNVYPLNQCVGVIDQALGALLKRKLG